MADLLHQLKDAIEDSGQSRYRIAQASGVTESSLSRFINGKAGLGIDSAERVAEALGCEIVLRKRRNRKGS